VIFDLDLQHALRLGGECRNYGKAESDREKRATKT
jgi:hypothetical protein